MQKILVIHSQKGDVDNLAQGIKEGVENNGNQVDVRSTEDNGRTLTFHPYDLVVVGSPTEGIFRGKIVGDIPRFLKNCKRTMGQDTVAFVTPRFFATTKALKKLMSELEKLGCIVNDFRTIRNYKDAVNFGKSL